MGSIVENPPALSSDREGIGSPSPGWPRTGSQAKAARALRLQKVEEELLGVGELPGEA